MTTGPNYDNQMLIGIGFRLATVSGDVTIQSDVDIEDALWSVIRTLPADHRLASILLAWIKVHGERVLVEKLGELRKAEELKHGEPIPWLSLIAAWAVEFGHGKWREAIRKEAGSVYLYDPEVSESAIRLKGAVPWLEALGFRIPLGSLRLRERDVLSPGELAGINRRYGERLLGKGLQMEEISGREAHSRDAGMYIAHIRKKDGEKQPLIKHLLETSEFCAGFAKKIGLEQTGRCVGVYHDFGKYSRAFQSYLYSAALIHDADQDDDQGADQDSDGPFVKTRNRRGDIDHSTAGAQAIWKHFPQDKTICLAYIQLMALAVSSHHSGLNDCLSMDGKPVFKRRMEKEDEKTFLTECRKSADAVVRDHLGKVESSVMVEIKTLFARIGEQNKAKTGIAETGWQRGERGNVIAFKLGLVARFLLSCLLDADRINSAEFEDPGYARLRARMVGKPNWRHLSEKLKNKLQTFKISNRVDELRRLVSDQCRSRAESARGIYTLTAPTGGGKTLASLRFALAHAAEYELDRVVYVIPYTSIIEQNAQEARSILEENEEPGSIVLEHHSNIQPERETWQGKLLADNWESPVVFTTMVQFLEALFAAGAGAARRMHALANSVLVFDEIQTLPIRCIHMFCNALNFLVENCGSSALLCTATQPLLGKLPNPSRGQLSFSPSSELAPAGIADFTDLRRVKFINHCRKPMNAENIAALAEEKMNDSGSCLVVVNTKEWADRLFKLCQKTTKAKVIYLSTLLCPKHRHEILETLRNQLDEQPVLCVSTQLIECGVDLSFGSVIRFAAGLDSILQAAGRCNRHGRRESGNVHIVTPPPGEEALGALADIKKGREVFLRLMDENRLDFDDMNADLANPKLMDKYYEYYFYAKEQKTKMHYPIDEVNNLLDMLGLNPTNTCPWGRPNLFRQSFREAGRRFHPIDAPTQGIIVPYGKDGMEIIDKLSTTTDWEQLRRLLRAAQQYTVNVYPSLLGKLEDARAVHLNGKLGIKCLRKGFYDEFRGVGPEYVDKDLYSQH
jgi:CRISPR-associated endonuclease/helicase Cas3